MFVSWGHTVSMASVKGAQSKEHLGGQWVGSSLVGQLGVEEELAEDFLDGHPPWPL